MLSRLNLVIFLVTRPPPHMVQRRPHFPYRERKCADTVGTVPVPWAGHYRCPNKIYGSNFFEQHSEAVMVWNRQNAECSLRKKYSVVYYNFRPTCVAYRFARVHWSAGATTVVCPVGRLVYITFIMPPTHAIHYWLLLLRAYKSCSPRCI